MKRYARFPCPVLKMKFQKLCNSWTSTHFRWYIKDHFIGTSLKIQRWRSYQSFYLLDKFVTEWWRSANRWVEIISPVYIFFSLVFLSLLLKQPLIPQCLPFLSPTFLQRGSRFSSREENYHIAISIDFFPSLRMFGIPELKNFELWHNYDVELNYYDVTSQISNLRF